MTARRLGRLGGAGRLLVTASLFALGAILTWLGAVGPPIDPVDAFWRRTFQRVPGLVDGCGDFTWLARSVPPLLAAIGTAIVALHRPRSSVSRGASILGLALIGVLAFATTQNAIPWGELHCVG